MPRSPHFGTFSLRSNLPWSPTGVPCPPVSHTTRQRQEGTRLPCLPCLCAQLGLGKLKLWHSLVVMTARMPVLLDRPSNFVFNIHHPSVALTHRNIIRPVCYCLNPRQPPVYRRPSVQGSLAASAIPLNSCSAPPSPKLAIQTTNRMHSGALCQVAMLFRWRRPFSDRHHENGSGKAAVAPTGDAELENRNLKYTLETARNDSDPSYQVATGAPVELESPLGYSVGPVTIIFLNVSKMIGTGVYSTRKHESPSTSALVRFTHGQGLTPGDVSIRNSQRHRLCRPVDDLLGPWLPDLDRNPVCLPRICVVFPQPLGLGSRLPRAGIPAAKVAIPDRVCVSSRCVIIQQRKCYW